MQSLALKIRLPGGTELGLALVLGDEPQPPRAKHLPLKPQAGDIIAEAEPVDSDNVVQLDARRGAKG